MSEVSRGGGGAFAKVVQKTLVRTRTKVLQRVGKAEKTTDDTFKENIIAFQKQQASALRLQKEMRHYINCVKAMSSAAKNLYAVLRETYEEDWYDPQSVNTSLNSLELMHTNYEAELAERVYTDLGVYVDQFPVYKEKMSKRNRKRLDYDNAKHAYESLYTAKKPDHTKLSKAQENLVETKSLFEDINNELHRDLPQFYEYRVELIANNLIKLFTAEATFHTNTGKLSDQLTDVLQTLVTSHAEEMERLKESPRKRAHNSSRNAEDGDALDLSSVSASGPRSPVTSNGHGGDGPSSIPNQQQQAKNSYQAHPTPDMESRKPPPARPPTTPRSPCNSLPASSAPPGNPFASDDDETEPADTVNSEKSETSKPAEPSKVEAPPGQGQAAAESCGNPFEQDDDEEAADEAVATPTKTDPVAIEPVVRIVSQPQAPSQRSASSQEGTRSSDSKPSTSSPSSASVLYQVMATHPYVAEDEDELNFEAGEIINVVEYDDVEEQDDGWLMGINTKTQGKGVFPANFTQKIARKT